MIKSEVKAQPLTPKLDCKNMFIYSHSLKMLKDMDTKRRFETLQKHSTRPLIPQVWGTLSSEPPY
jgi:hypothetical protein